MCSRPFETRSRPRFLAATHRGFAFYVAFPKSSIRPLGLPIYVARAPAAPFSLLPSSLYLDHSHRPLLAPATLAALPSTRAIPNRDVFYVADPSAPFTRLHRAD